MGGQKHNYIGDCVRNNPFGVVSKCLGFAHCRFNGLTISSHTVDKLKPHVEFRPVCPEVEIGLGIPRDPVRIVKEAEEMKLVQPATGDDVTVRMTEFAESFLNSVGEVDGFILKSRSPSCGLKDVKIYPNMEKGSSGMRGSGFFGGAVMDKFPSLPVEDEGRLTNFRIREHFFTKLFTMAKFRSVKSKIPLSIYIQDCQVYNSHHHRTPPPLSRGQALSSYVPSKCTHDIRHFL